MQEQSRKEREYNRQRRILRLRRRLIGLFMCVALLVMCIIAGAGNRSEGVSAPETDIGEGTTAAEPEAAPSPAAPIQDETEPSSVTELEYPFNTMSHDWGGDDLEGFVYHEIAADVKREGGYFPDFMQKFTFIICNQRGVDYEMVFALIEIESNAQYDAAGDGGESVGYMQIQEKWNRERMEKLGVADLENPYQNIIVGVDILAELQQQIAARGTDTLQADVLAAYNYGLAGAKKNLWDNGVHMYRYNKRILERAEQLKAEAAAQGVTAG